MSPKQPQPPSYHSAIPNNIPHDNTAQETSPSHLRPNPTGASPPHTTAYLPPHSQHTKPQDKVPDGGAVFAEAVQEQHKTIASDLPSATYPYATYPYTQAYLTSTPAITAVNANIVPASLFQPIHTRPDIYNPHGTTHTSTQLPFPPPFSTTNTPTHSLTSESLSLLNSITSPHDHLSHFLSTPSINNPWNSVAYHASPRRG